MWLVRVAASLLAILLAVAAILPSSAHAQSGSDEVLLARVGRFIDDYYQRGQNILGRETVTVQPLASDFSANGHGRRLVYDFHLEWVQPDDAGAAGPVASVVRQLISVDGRTPKPGDEPECLDPRSVTPEPLALLLPERRGDYVFTPGKPTRTDGRVASVLNYRSRTVGQPSVTWDKDCVHIDLPGRTRGKIWADASTGEILRFDEGIVGLFDFPVPRKQQRPGGPAWMVVERADSSIRYRPVRFADPDETLMLPASVETVTVVRNSGTPRVRVTQMYSNYRRFVTEGRVLE